MTKRNIDEMEAREPPAQDDLPWPNRGGSFIRDPETGALTPAEEEGEEKENEEIS